MNRADFFLDKLPDDLIFKLLKDNDVIPNLIQSIDIVNDKLDHLLINYKIHNCIGCNKPNTVDDLLIDDDYKYSHDIKVPVRVAYNRVEHHTRTLNTYSGICGYCDLYCCQECQLDWVKREKTSFYKMCCPMSMHCWSCTRNTVQLPCTCRIYSDTDLVCIYPNMLYMNSENDSDTDTDSDTE